MINPQRWFDISQSIKLAGLDNSKLLVKAMQIRTGKREQAEEIKKAYIEMKEFSMERGYGDPADFIRDYFSDEYTEDVLLYRRPVDTIKMRKILDQGGYAEAVREMAEVAAIISEAPEPRRAPEPQSNGKIRKPEKIMSALNSAYNINLAYNKVPGSPIEIPADVKARIIKPKRTLKYYREMSLKEREADNKFDYFWLQSKKDESGKFFYDGREILADNPLSGALFSDFDIEFRKIMAGIYNFNRSLVKNKSKWHEEILILKNYFEKKLDIGAISEASTKRLATAIGYLMKKLQLKIFESEEPESIKILAYFKSQLCVFYNFYRK